MYISRNILQPYPYYAYFYRVAVDESLPLDEQEEGKVIVFETDCDITEASHSWDKDFISAKYTIYFPFDPKDEDVDVRIGDLVEAEMYGLTVNGKVVGVFPSQLGGVTVYVQDTDV